MNQTYIFMYLSVMNVLFKLLLSQGNKINYLKRKVIFPEKVVTDVPAHVLGFSGVNFCLSIKLWEVTFVRHKFFGYYFMNNV